MMKGHGQKSPDNKKWSREESKEFADLLEWGKRLAVIWCACSRPCAAGPRRRRGKDGVGAKAEVGRHLFPCTCQKCPLSEPSAAEHPVTPVHEALRGGRKSREYVRATRSLTSVSCILGSYLHPQS